MKTVGRTLLCLVLLFVAARLQAQDAPQDAEGCKDSPLITRFPGGHINSCENKEFEQADFPLGVDKDGNPKTKHLEGEYHYWDMATREGVSEIQVFRNFLTALKNAGFAIDFTDSPGQIVAHKGKTWIFIDNRGTFYYQTIITEKEMQQEVQADASSLADEINRTGHVAVYGIHFDTGKAAILPDSAQILGEIVKLLQQDAALKLRVEGHTDNQGNAAANQALSEKRAQAVVAWLAAHGVGASRLSAKGLGQTQPIADNSNEEGRAKNRRVELVKQ
ncbi:MAG TPA: OmpA family protein [Methylomirabilota bacterium]|nr:OmpA family protein [Methylomirabilota bacterium]